MAHYSITNPPTKTLERGDTVTFTIDGVNYEHGVREDHLNLKRGANDKVFELLGLDPHAFAEKAYGYEVSRDTRWPEFKDDDFAAATRIVWQLFAAIAAIATRGAKPKPVELSSEDYTEGKIKVYAGDGADGEVGIWLEDHEHCGIRIAVVTTEGRKDGKAFLKLVADEDSREYRDRVAFDGNKIEFQV